MVQAGVWPGECFASGVDFSPDAGLLLVDWRDDRVMRDRGLLYHTVTAIAVSCLMNCFRYAEARVRLTGLYYGVLCKVPQYSMSSWIESWFATCG